ncbi:MAG TPA: EamA family transporter [Patescibacteria group bacterium]|nr:EamA family transporter [Patescibacteria group bacterium]
MWLLLLFVHVFALTGFNLILRKSLLNNLDKFTLATIMQTGIAVPMLALVIFSPPNFSKYDSIDFFNLAIVILLTIGLHITHVKALQYLEAGVFSIIYNLRMVIATILGIVFLNEDIVWLRILGGLLILVAIVIVRQKSSQSIRVKGVEWGIIAAFTIAFLNLSEKIMINSVGVLNYFPFAMLVAAAIMWLYLFYRKEKIDKALFIQPRMIQLMMLRAVSAYGFTFALATGALVSVGSYISGMSVILMVVMGALLLNERDYLMRKAIATAIAVGGLTIILLSNLL